MSLFFSFWNHCMHSLLSCRTTLCHAAARIYTPALVLSVSATHTVVDVSLEGVEDLLYGLDVGLQFPGLLRHPAQRGWKHQIQVEAQQFVHGLTGEWRLERGR